MNIQSECLHVVVSTMMHLPLKWSYLPTSFPLLAILPLPLTMISERNSLLTLFY